MARLSAPSEAPPVSGRAGGGKLVVPRGVFVTAPFALCSSLDLHLEAGAVIKAPETFEALGLPHPSTFKTQAEANAVLEFTAAYTLTAGANFTGAGNFIFTAHLTWFGGVQTGNALTNIAAGAMLTLKGDVTSPEQAALAEKVAGETQGVASVRNELTMRIPATQPAPGVGR